jgi:hypothetical protein
MGTNWLCFGSPFNLSYANLTFDEFSKQASSGFFGIHWPSPVSLFSLLFSPARGILFISPVLLLIGGGLTGMWRQGLRYEAAAIGSSILIYLLFNAGYVQWHGGWMFGPRYLTPVLALASFPIAFSRFRTFTWFCLLIMSAGQVWTAVVGMPHTPEEIVNPIPELILPVMSAGYLAINGGAVLLGLEGLPSVWAVVLTVSTLGLLSWCFLVDRKSTEMGLGVIKDGILIIASVAMVTGGLAFTNTSSKVLIYSAKAQLMSRGALFLKSIPLRQAAEANRRLAVEAARKRNIDAK